MVWSLSFSANKLRIPKTPIEIYTLPGCVCCTKHSAALPAAIDVIFLELALPERWNLVQMSFYMRTIWNAYALIGMWTTSNNSIYLRKNAARKYMWET